MDRIQKIISEQLNHQVFCTVQRTEDSTIARAARVSGAGWDRTKEVFKQMIRLGYIAPKAEEANHPYTGRLTKFTAYRVVGGR